MKRYLVALIFIGGFAVRANALPMMVDYTDIVAATLEDFESYTYGPLTSNETFTGFSASVNEGNLFIHNSDTFCLNLPNLCLINQSFIHSTRIFNGFSTGTNYIGFELFPLNETNTFRFDVLGGSGLSTFDVYGAGGRIGFGDLSGLISISITNLGTGNSYSNYSFDNVITGITADTSSVPAPSSLALLILGILGLSGRLLKS